MRFQHTFHLLTLISLIPILTIANAITELQFQTAHAAYSPAYFTNLTLSAQNGSLYNDMYVVTTLGNGFKMHLDVQLRLPNSRRYQSLFSYDVDICNSRIALRENLISKWFKSLLNAGNFMENCPISSGHYYLRGWRLEPTLVPKYLHPGDYRIKAHFYFGKHKRKNEKLVADCEVDGKLI